MAAFRFRPDADWVVREIIPVPTPKEGEVLVKLLASGVCRSDVSLFNRNLRETWNPLTLGSFTIGHEGAGTIIALGAGAKPSLDIGTYVAIHNANPCLQESCALCSRGHDGLCPVRAIIGCSTDGCWAPYIAIAQEALVPVPGNDPTHTALRPAVVAVGTDAVLTPWHALKHKAKVQPGQTVLVIGCGGLGLNAIQILKNSLKAGCVIATDLREHSLESAKKAGADHAVKPEELAEYVKSKGLMIDVAVDIVGSQATFDQAFSLVREYGTVQMIGAAVNHLQITPLACAFKDVNLQFAAGGNRQDLVEVLDAIAVGEIQPEVEERPLEECIEILQALHDGKVNSRIALVP